VDAPVAVVEDRVLATSAYLDDEKAGARALLCLKADDGSLLWQTQLRWNCWGGPSIGPYVLIGCSNLDPDPKTASTARGEVLAFELDTGAVKWRREVPGGVFAPVAIREGLAIFTATDGTVRAWDTDTGQERWTYDAGAPFIAGPAVTGKTVYVADLNGVVHALNLEDGKRQWILDLGDNPATRPAGTICGSVVVHRGHLFLAMCNRGNGEARAQNAVICIGEK
jgi:outer membrane protein assembly factor BamB